MKYTFLNKALFYTVTVIMISMFTVSCEKEQFEDYVPKIPEYAQNDVNLALQEIVDVIIETTHSEQFRMEIKKEALIDYKDDYIRERMALKSTSSDHQIIRLLKKYSENLDIERIRDLVKHIPNYEVTVPVNAEEWDDRNYQPLVAFIPSDFDDQIHTSIKAFDSSGETHLIRTDIDPEMPIILIRPKEDIDYEKYISTDGSNLKSRASGNGEYIQIIRTDDIGFVESWITGPRCELKCVTIASKTAGLSTDFFNPKRKEIKNKYLTVNHRIVTWDTSVLGQYLTMQWYEEDGGGTLTVGIGYKDENGLSGTVSYSIKDNDDDLGQKTVLFTDSEYTTYNTGRFRWQNRNY